MRTRGISNSQGMQRGSHWKKKQLSWNFLMLQGLANDGGPGRCKSTITKCSSQRWRLPKATRSHRIHLFCACLVLIYVRYRECVCALNNKHGRDEEHHHHHGHAPHLLFCFWSPFSFVCCLCCCCCISFSTILETTSDEEHHHHHCHPPRSKLKIVPRIIFG